MLKKKNRKPIHPILRNCLYIIVPIAAIVAFRFIGIAATWLWNLVIQAGWPIILTFVITFLCCAIVFGWQEMKKGEAVTDAKEEDKDVFAN